MRRMYALGGSAQAKFVRLLGMTLGLLAGCSERGATAPTDAAAFLCNGDPAVRLVVMTASASPEIAGSRLTKENGVQYMIVDGQCQFWALSDPYLDVRSGQLSSVQAAALATELRLSEWGGLQGQYVHGYCDGPSASYRFGDLRIAIPSACGAPDSAAPVKWLEEASARQLSSIYASAKPVDGPVRFLLVKSQEDVNWGGLVIERAVDWPLAEDPAGLAVPYLDAANYRPGTSLSALPPDADALRKLRREFVASGGLPYSGGFIPVLGPLDGRYELFVRDSIPLEDAQGLLFHIF